MRIRFAEILKGTQGINLPFTAKVCPFIDAGAYCLCVDCYQESKDNVCWNCLERVA